MQWQYKTTKLDPAVTGILKIKVDPASVDGILNQLGQDRWELVNIFVLQGEVTPEVVAVFKRPMQPSSEVSDVRGTCPACGYDLRGADHDACPECGWRADA